MTEYFVHETTIFDEGAKIGKGTKIWHFCHIMSGAIIGENCVLGQNCFVGSSAVIGNNVHIQNNVSVYDKVIVEDDVFLGPSMVFTNDLTPRSAYPKKGKGEWVETVVERGASIGANATIVCGVRIGHHSFVGAGAVVVKDVLPYSVVVGNPARYIGWMCECGGRLIPDKDNVYICKVCDRRYRLINERIEAEGVK
jgi:UDP-2-acetamido-3-amino-2,3-dideoxy-glucuronate N-acetyltransferase